jgi:hypothetical protein
MIVTFEKNKLEKEALSFARVLLLGKKNLFRGSDFKFPPGATIVNYTDDLHGFFSHHFLLQKSLFPLK